MTDAPGVRIAAYSGLAAGEQVELEWETPSKDEFRSRATTVRQVV
ncbi:hypothetical protein [Streptomyces sp. NPDC057580]